MKESKRKRLQYKIVSFLKALGDPSMNLEKLLQLASKRAKKAKDRFHAPQQDQLRHFINYQADHSSDDKAIRVRGCEFLAFEEGASQSTVSVAGDAEEMDLDSLPAQKGKEYLDGSVYFSVCQNHVVLMASRSLKSLELENYLNWYLIEKTKVLPSDSPLSLNDHLSKEKKKKMAKGVKGLRVSAPVKWHEANAAGETAVKVAKGATTKSKITPFGPGWEAVKAIFGSVEMPGGMSLENLADTPELEVSLFLRWMGKTDEDGESFLDSIASNLRHVDDELDYRVDTKAGSFGREEFKLHSHISTEWLKGRPKFDSLFPKMASWLSELARNDIIEP